MSHKNNDITRQPWAVQNGILLFSLVYFFGGAGILALAWKWALAHGWPSYPPLESIWAWGSWAMKSWSISPAQMDQGQGWLWPGRLAAALAAIAPLPLACLAGWWAAKPLPAEIHLKGRRLSTDPLEAAQEALKECKIAGGEGLLIHPQIPLSLDRETRHILILGGTGSGKTVMMVRLIRQAIDRPGDKLLVNDFKNEFVEILEKAPGAKGFVTFSPWDKRCFCWDIAADITNKADARTIASRLVPESDKDPMWGLAAQSILVSVFCKFQQTRPGKWDLQDVLTDVFSGYDNLREIVLMYNREGMYAVEDVQKTKTTQSFLITLSTFLSQVSDLAEAWKGKTKFSLRRWLLDPESPEYRNPSCKYILMGGNKRYAKLEKAYSQTIISALASIVNSPEMPDSTTRKLWLFLDELPQLGEIPELSQFFEIGRSKGCRVVVGTQDISQLRKIYGKDTVEAWTSMVGSYLIGRTGGRDTQKWLSELIGTRKIKKYQISYTKDPGASGMASGRQDQWAEIEEPVVRPEEFSTSLGRRPGGMECLYHPGGDTVYRLIWPFSPKDKIRPVVIPAEWTKGRNSAPVVPAGDQAGEAVPVIKPQEQEKPKPEFAEKPQAKAQQESPASPNKILSDEQEAVETPVTTEESPAEKIVEEVAQGAVEHLADAVVPGAGAAVNALEIVATVAEIMQQPPGAAQQIITPAPATPADVWLDELEEEEAV